MTAKSIKIKDIKESSEKGFTLIELLVVIGILAILMGIVLIAINPARQFNQANDTKRASDITAILNAIGAYGADNHGNLSALNIPLNTANPPYADAGTTSICHAILGTADTGNSAGASYISALPVDPETNNGVNITDCTGSPASGYRVSQDAQGRVTVSAPAAKINTPLSVTR